MSKQIELADIELPGQVERLLQQEMKNRGAMETSTIDQYLHAGARLALLALEREPLVVPQSTCEEMVPELMAHSEVWRGIQGVFILLQRRAFLRAPKTAEELEPSSVLHHATEEELRQFGDDYADGPAFLKAMNGWRFRGAIDKLLNRRVEALGQKSKEAQ